MQRVECTRGNVVTSAATHIAGDRPNILYDTLRFVHGVITTPVKMHGTLFSVMKPVERNPKPDFLKVCVYSVPHIIAVNTSGIRSGWVTRS